MNKEEKRSLLEYMVKHCGITYQSALKKFEKWENDKLKGRDYKRKVAEGKEMSKAQMDSIVIYMHKQGFTDSWIAESLGVCIDYVLRSVREYEKLIQKK